MLRCPYGLVDAGRLWYLRLKAELLKAGMMMCKYDQALFMWFDNGNLAGIMTCHVDDIIYGGQDQFHIQVVKKLKSVFSISLEEDTKLKYLGLSIHQTDTGISVSTQEYGNSLKELSCTTTSLSETKTFTSEQVKCLKQFCGQLNWLASQGRPDIAFDSCHIANSLKTDNPKVFGYANKVVRKVHNQDVELKFPSDFDLNSCSVVSFCDASFGNLPNGGSQGGFICFLIDKSGLYTPITWQSRKIRRVVKSTVAAECLAAVEAAETTIYLSVLIKDIFSLKQNIDSYVFCDNKNFP